MLRWGHSQSPSLYTIAHETAKEARQSGGYSMARHALGFAAELGWYWGETRLMNADRAPIVVAYGGPGLDPRPLPRGSGSYHR